MKPTPPQNRDGNRERAVVEHLREYYRDANAHYLEADSGDCGCGECNAHRLCLELDRVTAERDAAKEAVVAAYDESHTAQASARAWMEKAARFQETLESILQQCADCFIPCDRCGHESPMAQLDITLDIKAALSPPVEPKL